MKRYLISSERADRRNDERDCEFRTTKEYKLGDVVTLDGLRWFIVAIL